MADEHFREDFVVLEGLEGNLLVESDDMFEIDQIPTGFFFGGFGVVVFGFLVELKRIWVGGGGDFGYASNAGWLGVRVVEEGEVSRFHIAPHEVARLVVTNASPWFGLDVFEILDGEFVGFGFDEPVVQNFNFQNSTLKKDLA